MFQDKKHLLCNYISYKENVYIHIYLEEKFSFN